ncbi:hypothetical protein T484DRAFT_1952185 [Baffinella frigidus]|nr:hypothetical protein T484DRAFT_1952185 [Cryptophyta sp. CCMP2293]
MAHAKLLLLLVAALFAAAEGYRCQTRADCLYTGCDDVPWIGCKGYRGVPCPGIQFLPVACLNYSYGGTALTACIHGDLAIRSYESCPAPPDPNEPQRVKCTSDEDCQQVGCNDLEPAGGGNVLESYCDPDTARCRTESFRGSCHETKLCMKWCLTPRCPSPGTTSATGKQFSFEKAFGDCTCAPGYGSAASSNLSAARDPTVWVDAAACPSNNCTCLPCPSGTYKADSGGGLCTACGRGLVTQRGTGSSSESDCLCDDAHRWAGSIKDGVCTRCEVREFRTDAAVPADCTDPAKTWGDCGCENCGAFAFLLGSFLDDPNDEARVKCPTAWIVLRAFLLGYGVWCVFAAGVVVLWSRRARPGPKGSHAPGGQATPNAPPGTPLSQVTCQLVSAPRT